jgi:hypothetical protein
LKLLCHNPVAEVPRRFNRSQYAPENRAVLPFSNKWLCESVLYRHQPGAIAGECLDSGGVSVLILGPGLDTERRPVRAIVGSNKFNHQVSISTHAPQFYFCSMKAYLEID